MAPAVGEGAEFHWSRVAAPPPPPVSFGLSGPGENGAQVAAIRGRHRERGCAGGDIELFSALKHTLDAHTPGIFSLKQESSIFRSFMQPCMWF